MNLDLKVTGWHWKDFDRLGPWGKKNGEFLLFFSSFLSLRNWERR
jgi:hypothetical protein